MKQEKIDVLIVEPGKKPFVKQIENSIQEMQSIIGGYLQTIPLDKESIIVCNARGKADGLSANMRIFLPNEVDEFLYGPFFVAGYDLTKEHFASIGEKSIKKCNTIFKH